MFTETFMTKICNLWACDDHYLIIYVYYDGVESECVGGMDDFSGVGVGERRSRK